MQGFAVVLLVVVSNVDDEVALGSLDGMEFVVVLTSVACAGWNGREPLPGFSIIVGFANPDFLTFTPKSFAGVEKPSVGKLSGAVGAVDDGGVAFRPGNSAVGGANHPLPEFGFALCFRDPVVSGEPMRFAAVFWKARDVGE